MTTSDSALRLEDLLLIRALVPVKDSMTPNWFAKNLDRYRGSHLTSTQWKQVISSAHRTLIEGGFLTEKPVRITKAGEDRIRALFGGRLPGKGTQWRTLTSAWIPAAAMGLGRDSKAIDRMREAEGLRGTLLQHHEKLALPPGPTERQALDALVWRLLGRETDESLSVGALHAFALRQALPEDSKAVREATRDGLLNLYVAKLTGSRAADVNVIRDTVARKGIQSVEPSGAPPTAETNGASHAHAAKSAASPRPDTNGASHAGAKDNIEDFAAQVRSAAASPAVQRYGNRKAFISSVFDALPDERDLKAFKARLLNAHRAGAVRLAAADLVEAMDPGLVQRSEARYLNATYHFVELET